ncbi:MAG: hypothetical protein RL095_3666 [Verrucomicrobiota bacterium]|jgi:hypothetical protein
MKDKWLTRIAWTIAIITGLCFLWIWSLPYPLKSWVEAKRASRYQPQWPISEGEYREIVFMVNQQTGFRDVISGFVFYDKDPSLPNSPPIDVEAWPPPWTSGDGPPNFGAFFWQKAKIYLGHVPAANSVLECRVLEHLNRNSHSMTSYLLVKKGVHWQLIASEGLFGEF